MQKFYAVAIKLPDVSFAITQDSEVIHKYGLTYDVVFLLRKVFHIIWCLLILDQKTSPLFLYLWIFLALSKINKSKLALASDEQIF